MTHSVADKTSTPYRAWRRQTDTPGLWLAFVAGSLVLHFFGFLLLGAASRFNLASKPLVQGVIEVEMVEISSTKAKSKPTSKQVEPKENAVSVKPIAAKKSIHRVQHL
ncbi:MAG: hypothetical protein HC908_03015 [Calothrix sp. SM1_7_51]|nr:hypothetical protein [Calothrix sp. SM1_7_51]